MSREVLFFEDSPREAENELFTLQLRKSLRCYEAVVVDERTINRIEYLLRVRAFCAIVLDIMAAFPGAPAKEAVAGIEVLTRCRNGDYGPHNQHTPVYMRTARAEPHIRRMAASSGCSGYFLAGTEDQQLVAVLCSLLEVRN